ncbi:MAG: PQQ-binding-like beta-propeller repeat protein [Myxococcales bacterium]
MRYSFSALLLVAAACAPAADAPSERPQEASAPLSLPSGLDLLASSWDMAGHDAFGHHNNSVEFRVHSRNVDSLAIEWVFNGEDFGKQLGAIHATPVVTDTAIYVGTNSGRFLAVNLDGTLRWDYVTRAPNPLLALIAKPAPVGGQIPDFVGTPVVGGAVYSAEHNIVVFGDLDGNIYGLDADTGEELWVKDQVDAHLLGGVVGNSLVRAGDRVVVGFAAIEDAGLVLPTMGIPYKCCSHTGFVASFDIATGNQAWRFDTVAPAAVAALPEAFAPFKLGPSGADIWAQPAFDPLTQTIYVGTGQNYSPTAQGTGTSLSDSLIALDARNGKLKWSRQITANDIWVAGLPSPDANGRWTDQDFGDAPKIYWLPNGRKVIGAGQKSGAYTVLDARTGELVATTPHVQQANQLGGLQNGSAYGRGNVFVHGLNGFDPTSSTGPFEGRVMALSPDGAQERWSFARPFGVFVAPLALARDVLYFVSPVEEAQPGVDPFQFAIYALNADTGSVLTRKALPGRAVSGPVVSKGHVYVVTGNRAIDALGSDDEGSIIALGPTRTAAPAP